MPIATPQGTLDFKSVDTITFVGASSNTVIDTTTGSLGVGVGVGGPTSNLHVVGHTRLEGDINMLHTSNTASIKLNSNVVTEFSRSKKLIKYPRVALTSGQSGLGGGYTQDGYTVKVSNESSPTLASYVFNGKYGDNDATNAFWYTGNLNTYNGTPTGGYYVGTVNLGSDGGRTATVFGDWIELELPNKIKLDYFKYFSQTASVNGAQDGVLYARNTTNEDWTLVHSYTDAVVPDQNTPYTFNVNSTNYYKIYALVLTRKTPANTGTGGVSIGELEYYGIPEYDSEAHGTDVVVKSLPNVPNTDWLEVYYDGQDYTTMPATVDNKTGVNTYDATSVNGVGFDATQKAFTFDANSSQYLSSSTPISGNYIHTISMWFKGTNLTPTDGDTLMWVGDNTDNKRIEIYIENDRIVYNFKNNNVEATPTLLNNRWYHLTCTYNGAQGLVGREIYVDGQRLSTSHSGNLADLNITNSTLNVGGFSGTIPTYMFSGSIANFRLFNRALTSDEVWQLYAYQKEYFGHGDLSMTLKAGRLGIGTSEPRATLDVRGDVHISGSLRKTRARMIRLESGAKHFTLDGWQTYVSYGEAWTAYSSDPLYSISITGDYVSVGRAINYRIAVQNQRTDEVLYFPSSSGWIKYHYVDNTRLDGHGYLGIMSGLTFGDSYKVQLEVDPNSTNDYQWNTAYGTITGLVWD